MKKKISILGIIAILIISLISFTGCGSKTEESKKEDKKVTMEFGKTETIDDTVELTIKNNKVVSRIEPSVKNTYYTYYAAGTGYKWLNVTADVKNITSETVAINEVLSAKLYINDSAYAVTFMTEDEDGKHINAYSSYEKIDASETLKFHFATKIPEDLAKDGTTAKFVFTAGKKEYEYTMNIIDDKTVDTKEGPTINLSNKAVEIKDGQLVTIDGKYEFTINSNSFSNEVLPPNPTGFYTYLKAQDGKVYLTIKASVKNLQSTAVKQDSVLGSIKVLYNDEYEYTCQKVVETENGASLNTYTSTRDIEPLTTMTYYFVASVPTEVQTSTSPIAVKFTIDNIDYVYNIR